MLQDLYDIAVGWMVGGPIEFTHRLSKKNVARMDTSS